MQVELESGKAIYHLRLDDKKVALSPLIGEELNFVFEGEIHCINCGRKTKKSFNQGYCFPCCQRLAACDMCILKPETCHYHEGTCREPDWAQDHCMQDHFVYLANTSGLKVGITRQSQVPTRWIDQGAVAAISMYRVKSRYIAGLLEVKFKDLITDRTDWRRMLKGENPQIDLLEKREEFWTHGEKWQKELNKEHGENSVMRADMSSPCLIDYPVEEHPTKIKSFNLDKNGEFSSRLNGIKGQYLIFEDGVINIRKYTAYHIQINIG